MTTEGSDTPLRGDAAWRAEKARIAERNEVAYARGREQRAESDARAEAKRLDAQRHEDEELPVQPEG